MPCAVVRRRDSDGWRAAATPEWRRGGEIADGKLEVVMVPVREADRAQAFNVENAGFVLDVDDRAGDDFRFVQLTPPGSACSIALMSGTQAERGSVTGLHLVVPDIDAARRELIVRGAGVGPVLHFESGREVPGSDPQRSD